MNDLTNLTAWDEWFDRPVRQGLMVLLQARCPCSLADPINESSMLKKTLSNGKKVKEKRRERERDRHTDQRERERDRQRVSEGDIKVKRGRF